MTETPTPVALIWKSISAGDIAQVTKLLADYPSQIDARIPFGGGTFLHLAASKQSPEMMSALITAGFDIDKPSSVDGHTALMAACSYGNHQVAKYLLDQGAKIDVSDPSRNPLFGAVIGQSMEAVELLLERQVDVEARYSGASMEDMDAISFALERGESAIAARIADHIAGSDKASAERLLERAMGVASRNNTLR